MSEPFFRYEVPPGTQGLLVDHILRRMLRLSSTMQRRLKAVEGNLSVNGLPARVMQALKPGDLVELRLQEEASPGVGAEELPLSIIHEDQDLIVLDKPSGQITHPTKGHQSGTLANGLAWYYQRQGLATPIRHVNRLDRLTSGLILVAKSAFAHQRLAAQLEAFKLQREYLALARGSLPLERGLIDAPIGLPPGKRPGRVVRPDGQEARTHYQVLERLPAHSLLSLRLETGRTHQIRVHLAHLGHPLAGEDLYDPDPAAPRLMLHAASLAFAHPRSGTALSFELPPPPDFQAHVDGLRTV